MKSIGTTQLLHEPVIPMRDSIHFKRDKQMQQMPNFLLSPKKHAETTQGQPVAKPKAKSKSANSKRLAPLRCWRSLSFSPGFCKNHLFEPKKSRWTNSNRNWFHHFGGYRCYPPNWQSNVRKKPWLTWTTRKIWLTSQSLYLLLRCDQGIGFLVKQINQLPSGKLT